jgi:hypothetical protein
MTQEAGYEKRKEQKPSEGTQILTGTGRLTTLDQTLGTTF